MGTNTQSVSPNCLLLNYCKSAIPYIQPHVLSSFPRIKTLVRLVLFILFFFFPPCLFCLILPLCIQSRMFTIAHCQGSDATYNPKLNLFSTEHHFPNQWTEWIYSWHSFGFKTCYILNLFSIVSLSELLLRVEIMWQMWNEIIFLQAVLPRRIGGQHSLPSFPAHYIT